MGFRSLAENEDTPSSFLILLPRVHKRVQQLLLTIPPHIVRSALNMFGALLEWIPISITTDPETIRSNYPPRPPTPLALHQPRVDKAFLHERHATRAVAKPVGRVRRR